MKISNEATIHLVGRPNLDADQLWNFLNDNDVEHWTTDAVTDALKLPEIAGRLCYMSYSKPRPGGNEAYIHHIKEVGHGSVLEHASWNFILEGVSRSLTHELVRHRVGTAFSELSQRYVDASELGAVVPPSLSLEVECALYRTSVSRDEEENPPRLSVALADILYPKAAQVPIDDFHKIADAGERWLRSMERQKEDYEFFTNYLSEKGEDTEGLTKTEKRKQARQAARSVLPNAIETKIFLSANARALRHFFVLRCSRHADLEIRQLALKLLRTMMVEAPSLFNDFVISTLPDGTEEATTTYTKV